MVTGLTGGVAAAVLSSASAASSVVDASSTCDGSGAWPMYQENVSHTAAADSCIDTANVSTLTPTWFVSTPGAVTATPAVYDGTVYVGDSTGLFYALNEGSGHEEWAAPFDVTSAQSCYVDETGSHSDAHSSGFGEITSSAAVSQSFTDANGNPIVYFGGGGSLFALDAKTGACLWAQDVDPADPSSAIEIESSPVIDTAVPRGSDPEVLVGDDDNSSPGIAVTGLMAFDALTGALEWKYEPERDLTLAPSEFGGGVSHYRGSFADSGPDALLLSCGDGVAEPDGDGYCSQANIPGLPPGNSTTYADGCGDVWSSPAVDTAFVDPAGTNSFEGSDAAGPTTTKPSTTDWAPKTITASGRESRDGLVVFGTGNCVADPNPSAALAHGDYAANEGVFALDPVTGVRVWDSIEPYDLYDADVDEPGGGDDDFGSSALIAQLAGTPGSSSVTEACGAGETSLVIEGSKSGYAYGLCESDGKTVWSNQIAQPGEFTEAEAGSIGGMIGSPALGSVGEVRAVFFTSAIFTPLSNDGVREPGSGDTNISSCPGPGLEEVPVLPPACPDPSAADNPERLVSLHAVDAATGALFWQGPSLPTYSAATYTDGVVFAPSTGGFDADSYDATTGTPLWSFPLGAAAASGSSIVGDSVFLGSGMQEASANGVTLPPGNNGVWRFSTSAGLPGITPPATP